MTPISKFVNLDGFKGFEIEIRRFDEILSLTQTIFDQHRHNFCEIYINIDGDVSFVVEDKIYPVSSGTVIVTRPNEVHHCIYNGIKSHRHYCIWIKCDDDFLKKNGFYDNKNNFCNYYKMGPENLIHVSAIIKKLAENDFSQSPAEKYMLFFDFINTILQSEKTRRYTHNDTEFALRYIHNNYTKRITVKEIAEQAFISTKTLERHFIEEIKQNPKDYILKLKIEYAKELLINKGFSIADIAVKCGFSTPSHFISSFKALCGFSPLQYRKINSAR